MHHKHVAQDKAHESYKKLVENLIVAKDLRIKKLLARTYTLLVNNIQNRRSNPTNADTDLLDK